MARLRWRYTIVPIAVGFGLSHFARNMELIGDLDAAAGRRSDALFYHSAALFLVLAALCCFIVVGCEIVRRFRGGGNPPSPAPAPKTPVVPDEPAFDPDEIMARYLAKRPNSGASTGNAEPAPRGFGRKQL